MEKYPLRPEFAEYMDSFSTHRLPVAVADPSWRIICTSRAFARLSASCGPTNCVRPGATYTLFDHPAIDAQAMQLLLQPLSTGRATNSLSPSASYASSSFSSSSSDSNSSLSNSSSSASAVADSQNTTKARSAAKGKGKAKARPSEQSVHAESSGPLPTDAGAAWKAASGVLIPRKASRFWLPDSNGVTHEFVLVTFDEPTSSQPSPSSPQSQSQSQSQSQTQTQTPPLKSTSPTHSPSTAAEDIGSRIRLGLSVLSSIIKDTADAMITITANGTVVSFNPAASRIFGYQTSEIVGQNINILMPEPHRENHDSYLRNYQTTGDAKIIGIGREVTAVTKEGEMIPIHLSVSEIKLQDSIFYAGILRDLREVKKAEASVAKEHALLASIMDAANDAILTITGRGVIVSLNKAACAIFGYKQAELIGQNIKMLMPAPYRQQHDEYLSEYLRTGRAKIIGIGREVVCQRKDLSEFPADLSVSEVRVGDNVFFTGILRDLTERKKADSQIARGDAIVREVLMKSELLTKISNMFGEKESVAAVAEEFKLKISDMTSEMEKQFGEIQRRLAQNERKLAQQEGNLKAVDQSVRRWVDFKQETYSRLVNVLDSAFQGISLAQFPQPSNMDEN